MSEVPAKHMVIGGAGFLGSHIVTTLKARSDVTVGVFDLVQPSPSKSVEGVEYFTGDITRETRLIEVFKQFGPAVVYYTASPIHGLSPDVYFCVNEEGTRVVVSACRASGIKIIVYTSSTGVVWTGADLDGVTEDNVPVPSKGYDAYHATKALGEKVILNANDVDGMKVVILRPCGMTGERDKQLMWRVAKLYEDGQHNVQIGDNTNLVDYLYAGNAAQAHVLAADCLLERPETVAGQIFFITNGQPMPQWTFNRLIFKELGDNGSKKIIIIPRALALFLAMITELVCKITGKKSEFNLFNVLFATGVQWYNIDKARLLLGYEPKISLEEGIHRTVEWWKASGAENQK